MKKNEITLPRHFGGNAKVFLRDVARLFPEYHRRIHTGISGRSNDGREIPINNVGRWLFGTPGYMGHIRVSNWKGTLAQVEVPEKSPQIVFDLIQKIKEVVESGQVPADILSRWDEFFRRAGL